jgi:hypothetical protein
MGGKRKRSLNHLVGAGEDRWRDHQAERLGGLQVDHQLERCWLLDRQIGWPGAVENLPNVNAGLVKYADDAGSLADQAAGSWEFAPLIDCRHRM